jgi:SAM-dependent methyltransferase
MFAAACGRASRKGSMSTHKDKFNLNLAESQIAVDEINSKFYGRFSYPWPAMTFPVISDPQCGTVFLNQELGDWTHSRIPHAPKVWVAGCGTNQAVFTALRFPEGDVLGTDISTQSLAICQRTASQLGIKNLRLEERSLNTVTYSNDFDFIICTGVVHHNANPEITLARLSEALKPGGAIEIMVYNYFHRILTTAYQKAIRHLLSGDAPSGLDTELAVTRRMIDKFPLRNTMSQFLRAQKNSPEPALADSLLQPVEHSYTVESMGGLLKSAGLEFWLPCLNQFDKTDNRLTWDLEFEDEMVTRYYNALPDEDRWYITNLLSIEESPLLWFYAQRTDSPFKRKSENEVCQDFLKTKFERYKTTGNVYRLGEGGYQLVPRPMSWPSPAVPADETARKVFDTVDPKKTLGEVLQSLSIQPDFHLTNLTRIQLTTPLFPYLKAIGQ